MSNLINFTGTGEKESTVQEVNQMGVVTGAVDLDLSSYNIFEIEPDGTTTINFTNLPSVNFTKGWIVVEYREGQDVTWGNSISLSTDRTLFEGGTSGRTLIVFQQINDTTVALKNFYRFGIEQISALEGVYTELTGGATARTRTSSAVDQNFIYFFGGLTNSGRVNDTWAYNLSTATWSELNDGTGASTERFGACLEYYNNHLYMFSGYDGGPNNDTWEFDLAADTWNQLSPTNTPPARYYAASTSAAQKMYVFGGTTGNGRLNDIWEFDMSTNTWIELTSGTGPSPRNFSSLAYYNNKLFVFGGENDVTYFDDLWEYDISTNTWTQLPTRSPSTPISNPTLNVVGNNLYVFGGELANGDPVNQLWEYNIDVQVWNQKNSGATARKNHTTEFVNGSLYVYGGELSNGSRTNTLWRIT